MILQGIYSVFSALLLSLAIPNEVFLLGVPWLSFFALIPLYAALSRSRTYREAFLSFFIQTIVTHLASSFWLAYFKDFAALTLGASAVGTGFIGGFFGLAMFLPRTSLYERTTVYRVSASLPVTRTASFRCLYFAAVYTLYEWVKSIGFLGYPWGTLTSTLFRAPMLMQISDITGTYGITFLLALCNAVMAEFLMQYRENGKRIARTLDFLLLRQTAILTAALLFSALLYGAYQYTRERNPQKTLTAVMVQQNSDPWKQASDSEAILVSEQKTREELEELAKEGRKADLVIWSEGTLTRHFPDAHSYYQQFPQEHPFIPFVKEIHTPVLTGGAYTKVTASKKRKHYNAAIMFDGDGNFRGWYGKNHLVPFAEVIPGVDVPVVGDIIKKITRISAGWTPGSQYVYFDIPCHYENGYRLPAVSVVNLSAPYEQQKETEEKQPVVRACAPICFDDAFTDIMRPLFLNGAELFLNLTDDSWSLTKSAEYQHFVVAAYRAIEYRTTLVRSTNAGYSVVVSPAGRIIADLPLFEAASLACDIPVYQRTMTTYARLGNWLPWTLFVLWALYAISLYRNFTPDDYVPSERKKQLKVKAAKNK